MARFASGGSGGGVGTPGAGYEYSWTTDNDVPPSPSLPGYEIPISGKIGKAYTVGNYVRYYYDTVNNPDVWIEGKVTQVSFGTGTDYLNILVDTQGSAAQGFYPDTTTTLNAVLMVVGKSGIDGAGYSFEVPSSQQPSDGVNFTQMYYGVGWTLNGILGEAFGPEQYPFDRGQYIRVTFSTGDWIEGFISIAGRTSPSYIGADVWVEKWKGVTDLSQSPAEIASVALATRNVTAADAILGYNNFNIDPYTMYSGQSVSFSGNTESYSIGDYVNFSIDADNWIEGVVWSIGASAYGQYSGNIYVSVNKWNLTTTIAPTNPNIFVDYPNAKIKIVTPADAGYSGGPALATVADNAPNPPGNPVNPVSFTVGMQYVYYGAVGAYRMGDYVKLSYMPAPAWNTQLPPITVPQTADVWFEGTITSVYDAGTSSSLTVEIQDFNVPQEVIDYGGELWPWWSIGLVGKSGATGATGAGYDYVYPFDSVPYSPSMPAPTGGGTPFYVNASIQIPHLGAYAVGNFIRYYPNPDTAADAWVEGQITGISSGWMDISLNNGSPSAAGLSGVDGTAYTVAPYATLIGEKGEAGDTHILQDIWVAKTWSTQFSGIQNNDTFSPPSTSTTTLLSINKQSSTSSIEVELSIQTYVLTESYTVRNVSM